MQKLSEIMEVVSLDSPAAPAFVPSIVPRAGFVYFVRATGLRLIKIGRATNVEKRLSGLQQCCPDRLELIGQIACEDAAALEFYLHRAFAHCHSHGEWFSGHRLLETIWDIRDKPELKRRRAA